MTRITLDWLLQGTPFDLLFEQSAEGEYCREFTLEHLVLVMLDVVCGFNPSTRSAFLGRQLQLIASLSAFYGKLNRLSPAITAAVVRHTAIRCRALIEGGGGLLPEPIPGYCRPHPRRQRPGRDRPSPDPDADHLVGLSARQVAGDLRAGQRLDHRSDPGGERPHPGAPTCSRKSPSRPASCGSSTATCASAPSCSASREPAGPSWHGGTKRRCPTNQPGRGSRGGAARPARSTSSRSSWTIPRRPGRRIACG